MTRSTTTDQRLLGIIIDLEGGRTIEDTDKGPIVIWGACLIPVGKFDNHGERGYVVDVVCVLDPTVIRHGLILMNADTASNKFSLWCSQHGLPQPDGKNVRKIINGLVADRESAVEATYVDGVGEVEPGIWALANGVMVEGEFIPMERGHHRQTSKGRKIVYSPSITCEEVCGSSPLAQKDAEAIESWAGDMINLFGSMSPMICAAWMRSSVLRSRIEAMDAQLPALYITGDSHRGKTLMATVTSRMLGGKGERPHANMTSASNVGVFLMATMRSSMPFILDEIKPYMSIGDNDLVKSLVNGDIPAKSTRGGRLRPATRIKSMPILVSEFVPGDTSSIANRVFILNLVSLSAIAKSSEIRNWVWWADKYQELYDHWSHSIYKSASLMTDAEFKDLWSVASQDALVICDDASMNLNRSITATTIAIMGFKLMDNDCCGRLSPMYKEFCEALTLCLLEMGRLITDVSAIGRFITAIRSGWASIEGRYSKLVCDRVFTFSETNGIIVDHVVLHGLVVDSHRLDASRLGNPATVAMVLEAEGFTRITESGILKGRYKISMKKLVEAEWAHGLSRLMTLMDCSCAKIVAHAVDSQE